MLRTTRETDNAIYGFFEQYRPFSNFHVEPFRWRNKTWKTSEHAFQAAKTTDAKCYENIWAAKTASEAKSLGQRCPLSPTWEADKNNIMYSILVAKFSQSPILKELLLSTGEKYLEETNDWGDTYWGKDTVKGGHNWLGEILMRVREELR